MLEPPPLLPTTEVQPLPLLWICTGATGAGSVQGEGVGDVVWAVPHLTPTIPTPWCGRSWSLSRQSTIAISLVATWSRCWGWIQHNPMFASPSCPGDGLWGCVWFLCLETIVKDMVGQWVMGLHFFLSKRKKRLSWGGWTRMCGFMASTFDKEVALGGININSGNEPWIICGVRLGVSFSYSPGSHRQFAYLSVYLYPSIYL